MFIKINHKILTNQNESLVALPKTSALAINSIKRIDYNKEHYKESAILKTKHIIHVEVIVPRWDSQQRIMFQVPSLVEYYVDEIPKELEKLVY